MPYKTGKTPSRRATLASGPRLGDTCSRFWKDWRYAKQPWRAKSPSSTRNASLARWMSLPSAIPPRSQGRDRDRGRPAAGGRKRGDDRLDAALDQALARLSPSRAAAEVAESERSAKARLRPRARTQQMSRQAAEHRGRGAETLACWYLRFLGWRILARRARVNGGEVDVVARRGRTLAFVEVKARATEEAAGFALDEWRLRRVVAAAERLAPRYMREGDDVRIDAMFIVPGAGPGISPISGKGDKAAVELGADAMPLRVAVQMDPLEGSTSPAIRPSR